MALMVKLYNTLSRKKETFRPIKKKKVGLYACGPTVYWFAHIGNLRTYIFEDILRRILEYNGYQIKHVVNITDVGHLTSDADSGEDKIEAGAKKEKKTVWQIADFYTKAFKKDIKKLNIKTPSLWAKATDHIKEQIAIIKKLEKKGYTYKIADGIYFDTSKLKDYGKLAGKKKRKIKAGARVKIAAGKKNPTDFALWKFTSPGTKRQMEWTSPWGKGFPGWHTECVAMAAKYLGVPFDIHCGGIDHIAIHHTNEIAQAEAAYGKNLANFWLHGEFLRLEKGRMGKSKGNIILIEDLVKKGIDPLAYRYLCLTANYRAKIDFSWESLQSAQKALDNLRDKTEQLKRSRQTADLSPAGKKYKDNFICLINDNLNSPKALALTWQLVKDKLLPDKEKFVLIADFDKVFGLDLIRKRTIIPSEIKAMVKEREKYREEKNWPKTDAIREAILKKGYQVEDTEKGSRIKKI